MEPLLLVAILAAFRFSHGDENVNLTADVSLPFIKLEHFFKKEYLTGKEQDNRLVRIGLWLYRRGFNEGKLSKK